MNIQPTLSVLGPTKDVLWQRFRRVYEQLAQVVNGNIEFGNPTSGPANLRLVWVSVTTPAVADTDFTVTHNLGRPCVGYFVATKDRYVDIRTSPTANAAPNTTIILRASVVSAVITMILI